MNTQIYKNIIFNIYYKYNKKNYIKYLEIILIIFILYTRASNKVLIIILYIQYLIQFQKNKINIIQVLINFINKINIFQVLINSTNKISIIFFRPTLKSNFTNLKTSNNFLKIIKSLIFLNKILLVNIYIKIILKIFFLIFIKKNIKFA